MTKLRARLFFNLQAFWNDTLKMSTSVASPVFFYLPLMFYVFYQISLSVSLEEILIYLEASVNKMPWLWTLATFNVFDHDRSLKTLKDNTGFNRFDPTAWKLQCWLGKLWKNPSCGEACGPGCVLTPSFLCCMCFRGCLLPCFHRPVSLLSLLSRPHRSCFTPPITLTRVSPPAPHPPHLFSCVS